MYKIIKNITWCGRQFGEGDEYDFPEARRPEQIKALIDKGLIEPIKVAKAPEPVEAEKPIEKPKSRTETRLKGKK